MKDSGAYDYEILALVNEVTATGKGAKRNVMLAPVGASMVFRCSGPKIRDTNINAIPYQYSGSFSAVSKPNFASKK